MWVFLKKLSSTLLILSIICLAPTLSWAQDPQQPAEPTSVIPYQGTLFSQGKPVSQDAAVQMAFALYSGDPNLLPASATSAAPKVEVSLTRHWTSWTVAEGGNAEVIGQTFGVNVRNGRFLVHLGAEDHQRALNDSVFDTRPLYVVAWVVNSTGTFRLPPQKLDKVPHAVTAERATSFTVTQNLTVGERLTTKNLTVSENLETHDLTVTEALTIKDLRASGGETLFGDTLKVRRAVSWYNYDPDERATFSVSCLSNEIILNGGCSPSTDGLELLGTWPAADGVSWLCGFHNPSNREVTSSALALCLQVSN